MSGSPTRGTARERGTVVALVLLGTALPTVATLPPFHDVAWVLWLAALILLGVAVTVVVSSIQRGPGSDDS
ncbi:hypothetical protein ACFWCH_06780 [Microbacterium sp. NPDC060132]|uniref:hypothetical protein n=1 Tax=unclassified Microbacterium TaxID=2609290 RepID=UPI00365D3AEA